MAASASAQAVPRGGRDRRGAAMLRKWRENAWSGQIANFEAALKVTNAKSAFFSFGGRLCGLLLLHT